MGDGVLRDYVVVAHLTEQDGLVRFNIPDALKGKKVLATIQQVDAAKDLGGGAVSVVANCAKINDDDYSENDFYALKDITGTAMSFDGTAVIFQFSGPFNEIGLLGVGMSGAPDYKARLLLLG